MVFLVGHIVAMPWQQYDLCHENDNNMFTNDWADFFIFKFHFDLDYCQALYHEPLARVIAQALPVFDVKFEFTFTSYHDCSIK